MPQVRVPVVIREGTFVTSEHSSTLLKSVGGGQTILRIANRFYEKAFQDSIVRPFVADTSEPHGERLALWIVEKMGGEGNPWTDTRPPDSRTRSHAKAWHSQKRDPSKVGERFKLSDTRAWMRLMFWSAREEGLAQNKAFFDWFVGFIGHFIAVYERSAPPYAQRDAQWSEKDSNISRYIRDGRRFHDLEI